MNRVLLAAVAMLVCAGSSVAHAQDSVLAELYGQGVHDYFAGNYSSSHELLTNAIERGSRDPRCFYFRALTYYRLGRPDEAEADLKKGAMLEASSTDRIYPVADSLQRVQGKVRTQIEKQRQTARLTVRSRAHQVEQARFEQLQRAEQEVLRNPNRRPAAAPRDVAGPRDAGPRDAGSPNAGPPPQTPVPTDQNDPFGNDLEATPEKAPERPPAVAAEATPVEDDPFGAVTPGTPAGAAPAKDTAKDTATVDDASDPFAAPAASTPDAVAPAADDAASDPFANDEPAGAMPAETPPADSPPADSTPAEPAPADASDPFGA